MPVGLHGSPRNYDLQVSSIAISQPLDVIKTRIQNQNFESKVGGMTVIRELIKNEGFSAFFKGLTPKVLYVCTLLLTGPTPATGAAVVVVVFPLFSRDLPLTLSRSNAL